MTPMLLLILGVALFVGVHLIPHTPLRAWLVARGGTGAAKGVVAIGSAAAIAMMVVGYGQAAASAVQWFAPAPWAWASAPWVLLPACVLFVMPYIGGQLRWHLRHPQLIAVALWAAVHVMANGDAATTILAGGLLVWALAALGLHTWHPGPPAPRPRCWRRDGVAVAVGVGAWAALLGLHTRLFSVPAGPWF